MSYPGEWIPFEVPTLYNDNAHDIAERWAWWFELTNPLLDKLRAVGYKSARLMTRRDMKNTAWVVVDEHINNPNDDPWPYIWDIVQHSGLGIGCGNGNNVQLTHFQGLQEGLDETHGRRGWTTAPCRQCFPERYETAVKAGAKR